MNQEQTERTRMESLKKLDSNAGFHKYNCVRISNGESERHILAKVIKCVEIMKLGHKFVTEAKSKDRKREFDVVDLDTGEIFEFEKNPKVNKGKDVTTVRIQKEKR